MKPLKYSPVLKGVLWLLRKARNAFMWLLQPRTLCGIGVLLALWLIVVAEENWRGQRAWNQFRQEWEAKGERFDLADFIPPPIPDEQNFAMTPVLAAYFDYQCRPGHENDRLFKPMEEILIWRETDIFLRAQALAKFFAGNRLSSSFLGDPRGGRLTDLTKWQECVRDPRMLTNNPSQSVENDVLSVIGRFDPVFDELRSASQRPQSRYPIRHEDGIYPFQPQLIIIPRVADALTLRSIAEIRSGKTEEALTDIRLIGRLAESLRLPAESIVSINRATLLWGGIRPIWEGMVLHKWSEPQLRQIETLLRPVNLLEDYQARIRYERVVENRRFDELCHGRLTPYGELNPLTGGRVGTVWRSLSLVPRLCPRGWTTQTKLAANWKTQAAILPLTDPLTQRFFADRWQRLSSESRKQSRLGMLWLPNMLRYGLFNMGMLYSRIGYYHQTLINQALIACGLERYRITHGRYPVKLNDLVPDVMSTLPHDLVNDQPLRYVLTSDGGYVLYSVGLNGKDDNVAWETDFKPDETRDDLLWRCPAR